MTGEARGGASHSSGHFSEISKCIGSSGESSRPMFKSLSSIQSWTYGQSDLPPHPSISYSLANRHRTRCSRACLSKRSRSFRYLMEKENKCRHCFCTTRLSTNSLATSARSYQDAGAQSSVPRAHEQGRAVSDQPRLGLKIYCTRNPRPMGRSNIAICSSLPHDCVSSPSWLDK